MLGAVDASAGGNRGGAMAGPPSRLFVVRLWVEDVGGGSEYRGSVRDVGTDAFRCFREARPGLVHGRADGRGRVRAADNEMGGKVMTGLCTTAGSPGHVARVGCGRHPARLLALSDRYDAGVLRDGDPEQPDQLVTVNFPSSKGGPA